MNPKSAPQPVTRQALDNEANISAPTRRSFLQIFGAAFITNSAAGELASAVADEASVPTISTLSSQFSVVIDALKRNFEIEKKVRSLGDPHRVFLLVRGKIADEFEIIDGEPKLNLSSLEQSAESVLREMRGGLHTLLEERQNVIMQLHTHRDLLSEFVKQACPDKEFDLGRFSGALTDKNSDAHTDVIRHEIGRENQELKLFAQEGWKAASDGAKYTTNRYDRSDGTSIYRKADGGFSLNQKDCASFNRSSEKERVSLTDWSFSPEMYQKLPAPPNPRSLNCEHEPLERELFKYLCAEVEKLLDAGEIGVDRLSDFLTVRLNPLLIDDSLRGRRYLEILRSYTNDELAFQHGSRLAALVQSPRETIACEVLHMLIGCLDFEQLASEKSPTLFRLFQRRALSTWEGPFAKERNRRIIYEAAGESVRELIREGRFFFNNYPILNIDQFQGIARSFRYDPRFSETVLSIYDRTLLKGIDMGALLRT
jgi:hypothetical protein